jgi:sec-independent protein translocase protein TatA
MEDDMLGIGGHLPEIIIVMVVVLIIWGPGKLPDLGAAVGKGIREFRKATSEVRDSVMSAAPAPTAPNEPAPPESAASLALLTAASGSAIAVERDADLAK